MVAYHLETYGNLFTVILRRFNKFFFYTLIIFIACNSITFAQTTPQIWKLSDCLNYAKAQNIQIKQNQILLEQTQSELKASKAQWAPTVSASTNQTFTNYPAKSVAVNNSYTGNYGISASWNVFNGFYRTNSIKQKQKETTLKQLAIENSVNNISISILEAYLQILYHAEAVEISRKTLEVALFQKERAERLLSAGSLSQSDFALIESDYSADNYQLVLAQSNLSNYKLQLKQLLELDINQDIELQNLDLDSINILEVLPPKDSVYKKSLATMPEIKSAELDIEVAKYDIKKAQSGYYPSLNLSASIGAHHTTNPTVENQFWNSYNNNVGLSLKIPIYSQRQNKTAVEKAKLSVQNAELELTAAQKALLKAVEITCLDAQVAQEQYIASGEKLIA